MNFYCAKCNEKYVFFFRTDRKTIEKVGQSPSFGDLQGIEINKYKDLISKYFIEFKSSINCYSQGKGIAAFVYLRRILEDLIEKNIQAWVGHALGSVVTTSVYTSYIDEADIEYINPINYKFENFKD